MQQLHVVSPMRALYAASSSQRASERARRAVRHTEAPSFPYTVPIGVQIKPDSDRPNTM